jgi:hypothetical protein
MQLLQELIVQVLPSMLQKFYFLEEHLLLVYKYHLHYGKYLEDMVQTLQEVLE